MSGSPSSFALTKSLSALPKYPAGAKPTAAEPAPAPSYPIRARYRRDFGENGAD